jgi:hypothetical protein
MLFRTVLALAPLSESLVRNNTKQPYIEVGTCYGILGIHPNVRSFVLTDRILTI